MGRNDNPEAWAPCLDCGMPTVHNDQPSEYYMVRDDVWEAAGMRGGIDSCGEYLCIGCLETRLGRTLTGADFSDARCNQPHLARYRLTERLYSRIRHSDNQDPV